MKDAKGIILPFRFASTCYAVPPANQIRIIGGHWRGRRVRFPAREGIRPTPDRVRETLFNWLGQDLAGASRLDALAVESALCLEALRGGAGLAAAIDGDTRILESHAS